MTVSTTATTRVKRGLAEMLKGGVIMDVVTAEQARIADFVHAQPNGLGMPIESDAANLSGGQRQRIAIARALLHDSPVFVFDEATSSVDMESEELILDTLREFAHSPGTTAIMEKAMLGVCCRLVPASRSCPTTVGLRVAQRA